MTVGLVYCRRLRLVGWTDSRITRHRMYIDFLRFKSSHDTTIRINSTSSYSEVVQSY